MAVLRFLFRWVPTMVLQEMLVYRAGVTIVRLGPEDRRAFAVSGPCIVTVNRD